jgi:NAD(P)-dependent dehydrogenase (short-subunit alcohol dehydrogenase family)
MPASRPAETARVAMVSGANRGIGLAVARALAAEGWALSLGVRRPENIPDLAVPAGLLVSPYEAKDEASASDWVRATLARFGRLDGLVANAGVAPFVGLEEGDLSGLDTLLDVNVKGPFRLVRAAFPALKRGGSGRVVIVASLSGKRILGLNAGYQMSKHAMVALAHAVRRAGHDHGIRATALCPGFVATDLTVNAQFPRDEMTAPEDVARLAALVMGLPNSASVAELLVNCRYESML